MKENLRKITAFTASVTLMFGAVSCGKNENEEISDSQESSQSSESSESLSSEKTVIRIANIATQHAEFLNKAKGFETDKYTVDFVNYLENAEKEADNGENIDALARETLQMDMISGDCPDVIIGDGNFIMSIVDDGYFTDLYPLMDAGSVPRAAFLPNVLDGFERDGKLPVISSTFVLRTAAATTEFIPKDYESWSLDEMNTLCESLPDNMQLLNIQHTKTDLPNYMLNKIIRDSVDFENNTCDFHSTFLDAFEFIDEYNIERNLSEMTETEQLEVFERETDGLKKGTALLSEINISGINAHVGQQIYDAFGGADITFAGYPSAGGCGAVTETETMQMYAILENSDCKEGAWEFICEFFSEGYLLDTTIKMQGIPVIESVIDSAMEYNKWDSRSINAPFSQTLDGEILSQIDEKSKQAIKDYIMSVEINPYFDTQLMHISREEYLAVINGEKSPEEAADLLENRISLYLNERG